MKSLLKYYITIVKKYKLFCFLSILTTVVNAVLQVFIPLFFKFYIDKISLGFNIYNALIYLGLFMGLLSIVNFTSVLWHYLTTKFGGIILYELRQNLINKLNIIDYEKISEIGFDKIKNILFFDTLNVFRNIGNYVIQFSAKLLIIIFILIIFAFVNFQIFLIVIAAFTLGLLVSHYSRKIIERSSGLVNLELKKNNSFLNNYVESIKLIKTNPVFNYFNKKHSEVTQDFIHEALKSDKTLVFYRNILGNLNYVFILILISYFIFISSSNLSIGNIVLLMFYTNIIFSYSQEIDLLYSSIGENLPSLDHVNNILTIKDDEIGDQTTINKIERIELQNISFKYSSREFYILKEISNTFNKGDVVKITGSNGCGKTTFVNLITGLLKPISGSILFNSIKQTEIEKEKLKSSILFIGQDEIFINDSLINYFNIIAGKKVESNLINELLNEIEFFEQDINNVDSLKLDLKGESISLGQRKKILILKLLLRFPASDVIIIDELDANLDIQSQSKLQKIKEQLFKDTDKIVFEISHKKDNSEYYNRFFNVANSQLTEYYPAQENI